MPVEFTLPLSPMMQAVADAREVVQQMEEKVEDAKTVLKAAKAALEDANSDLNNAVDEMIARERSPDQPSLFDGVAGESPGEWKVEVQYRVTPPDAPASEQATEQATETPVEVLNQGAVTLPTDGDPFQPLALAPPASSWRTLPIAGHLDDADNAIRVLHENNVSLFGDLAAELLKGETFGLSSGEVMDLKDVIEHASADDAEPVKFDKAEQAGPVGSEVPGSALNDGAPLYPEPEPAKPKRGRKKKEKEKAGAVEVESPAESPAEEPEPVEAAPAGFGGFDDL